MDWKKMNSIQEFSTTNNTNLHEKENKEEQREDLLFMGFIRVDSCDLW